MQGDELKAIRKSIGATQDQWAAALGVSRVHVGQMERGDKKIERRTEWMARLILEQFRQRSSLRAQREAMESGQLSTHTKDAAGLRDTTSEALARVKHQLVDVETRLQMMFDGAVPEGLA